MKVPKLFSGCNKTPYTANITDILNMHNYMRHVLKIQTYVDERQMAKKEYQDVIVFDPDGHFNKRGIDIFRRKAKVIGVDTPDGQFTLKHFALKTIEKYKEALEKIKRNK